MTRLRDERGMTTIQVAILFPAVLIWLMLIVQYGLWWHAKQVANAAAAEAVDAAQVSAGTARDRRIPISAICRFTGSISVGRGCRYRGFRLGTPLTSRGVFEHTT